MAEPKRQSSVQKDQSYLSHTLPGVALSAICPVSAGAYQALLQ